MNKNVIEFGCGYGFFTKEFAKIPAKRIVGLDLSESIIDLAKDISKKEALYIEYYVHNCCISNPFGSIFDINFTSFVLPSCLTEKFLEESIIE